MEANYDLPEKSCVAVGDEANWERGLKNGIRALRPQLKHHWDRIDSGDLEPTSIYCSAFCLTGIHVTVMIGGNWKGDMVAITRCRLHSAPGSANCQVSTMATVIRFLKKGANPNISCIDREMKSAQVGK